MPGNVPNISRDSFDFTKFYDGVVLQQGVPIPDSDWNEFNDVLRMARILDTAYVIGTMRIDTGFEHSGVVPALGGPTDNNFELLAGHAVVDGVLTPTTNADPPAALQYESAALGANDNYIVAGVVTSVGGGILTCDELNLASFHDFLANAFHGAARVRMLTGTEAGNDFEITAFTGTTITLGGGTGTIAATDTFKVIPPALTTPGGARNDHAYLMVWWEDIAYEEDNNIQHPSLGVETAHRAQRRWCVRVIEDGTTVNIPTSTAIGTFDVRYLYLFSLTRSANAEAYPPNAVPVAQLPGTSLKGFYDMLSADTGAAFIGLDRSNFWSGIAPTAIEGAGLLNSAGLTTLETALLNIEQGVQRRRAFTAVLTDGTLSTGGDYNGPNVIDKIGDVTFAAGGSFFLRRGDYEFSAITSVPDTQMPHVKGEMPYGSSGGALSTITLPAGTAANFDIQGKYEDLHFKTAHATYQFETNQDAQLTLRDVELESGILFLKGGTIDWRGGRCGGGSVATGGLGNLVVQEDTNLGINGIIENVTFDSPHAASQALIYFTGNSPDPTYRNSLTFRNCRFDGGSKWCIHAASTYNQNIVFENCTFWNDSETQETIHLVGSGFTFRDCTMYNEQGPVLEAHGLTENTFVNCRFESGPSTAPAHSHQMIVVYGTNSEKPTVFKDCSVIIGDSAVQGTPYGPVIELGGVVHGWQDNWILVDGLHIDLQAASTPSIPLLKAQNTKLTGKHSIYRNVTLDMNNVQAGQPVVTPELGEGHMQFRNGCHVYDLSVINIANPSTTMFGSILAFQGNYGLVDGVELRFDDAVGGGSKYNDWIYFNMNRGVLRNVVFEGLTNSAPVARWIYVGTQADWCVLEDIVLPQVWSLTPDVSQGIIDLAGSDVTIRGIRGSVFTGGTMTAPLVDGGFRAKISDIIFAYDTGSDWNGGVIEGNTSMDYSVFSNIIFTKNFASSSVYVAVSGSDYVVVDSSTFRNINGSNAGTIQNAGTGSITGNVVID